MISYENTYGICGYFTPSADRDNGSDTKHNFLTYKFASSSIRKDKGLFTGLHNQSIAIDGFPSEYFLHGIEELLNNERLDAYTIGNRLIEMVRDEEFEVSLVYLAPASNNLLLIGDRNGSNSLYYSLPLTSKIFFATDLRLILYYKPELAKIDQAALLSRLFIGYPLLEDTLFSDIKQLESGEYIWHQANGFKRGFYWKPVSYEKLDSREEVLDEMRLSLRRILLYLKGLREDDYVFTLSGSLDSRFLLASLLDSGIKPRVFSFGRKLSVDVNIARELTEMLHLRKDIFVFNKEFLILLGSYAEELSVMSHGMLNLNYSHIIGLLKRLSLDYNVIVHGSWAWDSRGKWEKVFPFMSRESKHWTVDDFGDPMHGLTLLKKDFIEEARSRLENTISRAEERYRSFDSNIRARMFTYNHKNMKKIAPMNYCLSNYIQPFYPLHSLSWIDLTLRASKDYSIDEDMLWDYIELVSPVLLEVDRELKGISVKARQSGIDKLATELLKKIGLGEKPRFPTRYEKWTSLYLKGMMQDVWNRVGGGFDWLIDKDEMDRVLTSDDEINHHHVELNRIFAVLCFLMNTNR